MGYSEMETGLATVIKLLSGYTTTNVAQGNYRILGNGVTKAVILQPGAIQQRSIVGAPRRQQTIWVCNIELWIPFLGEISTVSDSLRSVRQALIDHIDKYPTLSGTSGCINAFITGAQEPTELPGDPRRWWMQELQMTIEERTTITIASGG